MRRLGLTGALLSLSAVGADAVRPHPIAEPGHYRLHPVLELSCFAAEPQVVDPVALTFDERGRAYVVEMRDYPYGLGPDHRPGGTVRLLEDLDGDGRADRSVVFAENLSFPTSILAWDGGVLVTAPPELLFLKDTDGDGQSDVREVRFTGFELGVTDSNVNGLRWALDNRVHCVNGGNGGTLRRPGSSNPGVALGNRDFRFWPDAGDAELTAHTGGGFGLVFDDWGRSFTPHNVNHLQQRVAPADRFTRFPGLPSVDTTHSISDHGEMARIYPVSVAQTRPNHPEQAGHFSSAGGMGYLGHQAWPAGLAGSLFVCDVVGNLVHRDRLSPDGPIRVASRAPEELQSEFFASRDPSFRPVGLELGPDGALYLLDMQREVIEHPDYIPAKLRETLDLRAGEDRGRIYRIAPKGWPLRRELPGLAPARSWIEMLGSPNQWTRLTAQRLLVHRGDATGLIEPLQAAARSATNAPLRLHALWTLNGLDRLSPELLAQALTDPHPGIRENALQMAAARLDSPGIADRVLALLDDPEAPVRFHALLASGSLAPSAARLDAVAAILARDTPQPWMRRAALAALPSGEARVLQRLLESPQFQAQPEPHRVAAVRELAALVGARGLEFDPVLQEAASGTWAPALVTAILAGLHEGLERAPRKPALSADLRDGITRIEQSDAWPLIAAAWRLRQALGLPPSAAQERALGEALRAVRSSNSPEARRLEAIRLIGVASDDTAQQALLDLLRGSEPAAVQQAAFEELRTRRDPRVGQGLVRAWPELPPTLRAPVVNLWVYRPPFQPALIDALESGLLHVGELNLDLEHRRQLLRHAAPALRSRAAKFMSDEEYSNRAAVVDQWLPRLPAEGDPVRARPVFERLCAQCHRVGALGRRVGPELTGMSHRSVEDLLSNILDPNMALNPAYAAYTAELDDGEAESGILVANDTAGVTLLQPQEIQVHVPRSRLRQLRAGGRSLMPEGLEVGLQPQDLRDLIALIQAPADAPPAAPNRDSMAE